MKQCSKCKELKTFSEFSPNKTNKNGFMSRCKVCRSKDEKLKRKDPTYNEKCKTYKQTEESRARTKDLALQRLFGISLEYYNQILTNQNNKCAICGRNSNKNGRALNVDHNHQTGVVRGILCSKCNQGLGYFDDNVDFLKNAIMYLINNEESRILDSATK